MVATTIELDEARQIVLTACPRGPPSGSVRAEALGCVRAEGVVATEAVPPFANTSVDGYAGRAVDTTGAPVRLPVVDELPAGAVPNR
jgi:molybdopterin molybdotransferase